MGLFKKKECSVCGGDIGLLGNTKLEDGNLCKNCAAKLSPWFHGAKNCGVDQILQQLEYREANKKEVERFRTTRTLGKGTKVHMDEDACKFMVTSASNIQNANPDVLNFADVTGVEVDIDESKREIMDRNASGERVSFNPPHYEYEYHVSVVINVNHPYFNEIRFKLDDVKMEGLRTQSAVLRPGIGGAARLGAAFAAAGANRPTSAASLAAAGANRPTAGAALRTAGAVNAARPMVGVAGSETKPDPYSNYEFVNLVNMGEEIRCVLMQIRQEARAEEASAGGRAVACPWCGTYAIPDSLGRCVSCGGPING